MPEFKTNFMSISRDIDRWMELYGTPDKLGGTPYLLQGLLKAEEFVFNLYFEQEAWDALVDHLVGATTATEWSTWPWLLRLKAALIEMRDVRRLKRCWGSMIAEQKIGFWEFHSFCKKGRIAGSIESEFYDAKSEASLLHQKKHLLETLEEARQMMLDFGETNYALKLSEDYQSIQQETRGKKLPKPVGQAMDENCFWDLIGAAKQGSVSESEQMESLLEAIQTFKASEIKKFRSILDTQMDQLYHWDVWALAFFAMQGCSDDAFDYFRQWLILQGRDLIATAKDDVQKLERLPFASLQVEGLLAIPEIAYESRSGKPLRPAKPKRRHLKGKAWEESDLQNRYPALQAKYA